MKFHIISIFPELFDSWTSISMVKRAREWWVFDIDFINPRDFTADKHKTVDDRVYGWGEWLLLKAKPIIDSIESVISWLGLWAKFMVLYPSPSDNYYNQTHAHRFAMSDYTDIIIICWRYEWIDHRFELYMQDHYGEQFIKISLWHFVVYGGEVPSMMIMESIIRLLPDGTHKPPQIESYYPAHGLDYVEFPHYTRPDDVYGYIVPDVLLSWHHKNIDKHRGLE